MLEACFFHKRRVPLTLLTIYQTTRCSSDVANHLPDNTVSDSKTKVLTHIAVTVKTSQKTHCGLTINNNEFISRIIETQTNARHGRYAKYVSSSKAGGGYAYSKHCALKGSKRLA